MRKVFLKREALAAAALALGVRVFELEGLVEALAHEIDPRAVEGGEAFGVDVHLDALVLDDDVVRAGAVGVIDDVAVPRAARRLYGQAQAQPAAATLEAAADTFGG